VKNYPYKRNREQSSIAGITNTGQDHRTPISIEWLEVISAGEFNAGRQAIKKLSVDQQFRGSG
jgi:hypothetical protein